MKTLYLVRHAKSSWDYDVDDRQRPLNRRGEADIVLVSQYVASHFAVPDMMISSDAKRALTTALQFKKAFGFSDADFFTNADMYDFSGGNVQSVIENCNDDVEILMLFGHNNALTNLTNKYGNKYIDNIPTCGFVKIEWDTNSWKKIAKGKTVATVFPRDLK